MTENKTKDVIKKENNNTNKKRKRTLKDYYWQNKEFRERHIKNMLTPVKCSCGAVVNRGYMSSHKKTNKHKKMMEMTKEANDILQYVNNNNTTLLSIILVDRVKIDVMLGILLKYIDELDLTLSNKYKLSNDNIKNYFAQIRKCISRIAKKNKIDLQTLMEKEKENNIKKDSNDSDEIKQ